MKDIDKLMKIAIKEQYKELCDKIKMQLLQKLEEYAVMKSKDRNKMFITFDEIAYMRMKLDEIRSKEHEKDMRAIGGVISMIINRSDEDSRNLVEKHCIDKNKVKEAIDKVFDIEDEEGKVHNKMIKQELGL